LANLLGLDPEVRRRAEDLVGALRRAGYSATITSAYRSPAEQKALWRHRASNPFPVAPPGCSTHEYGFAVDLVTDYDGDLYELGRDFGFEWAGPRDVVHFDVWGSSWRTIVRDATGHVC
jgi:LAS superfamily LD-carboxypeptidase LdcB